MKKKSYLLVNILLLAFVFTIKSTLAQEPGNWGNWETMPCYQGITVSIVNMGHSKSAGGYLWGIRLKNNYATPVTFRYRLSVGEKNTSQEGGDVVWKLKPGEVWTDGRDKFTAKLYQSPSTETNCYIWSVSFGDVSNCYAGCDVVKGKENQQCPVANKKPATATNTSGGGNTNTPGGKTNPAPANNGKPTTTGSKTEPSNIFSRAEAEKEMRRAADLHCKMAEAESKLMDLELEGAATEKHYKDMEKLCKEAFDLIELLDEKYSESKNKQAAQIWGKIRLEGIQKCKYKYDGYCAD
jgi:hypothetical protein